MGRGLGWVTPRGPFQPSPCLDSVKLFWGNQPPGWPSPPEPSEPSGSPDSGSTFPLRDGGTLRNHPEASSVDHVCCTRRRRASSAPVPAPTPGFEIPLSPRFLQRQLRPGGGRSVGERRDPSQPFPCSGVGRPGWSHHPRSVTAARSPRAPAAPRLRLPHGPALAASSPQTGNCGGK